MTGIILRASIIAVIVSLIVSISIVLATGETVRYKVPMVPSKFYVLSYEEQQAWRQKNEIRYGGFAHLRELMAKPYHLWQLLWGILILFAVIFLSCLVMAKWEGSGKGV